MTRARTPDDSRAIVLTMRPPGRGNWRPVEVVVNGRHAPPALWLQPGDVVHFGPHAFRIVSTSTKQT